MINEKSRYWAPSFSTLSDIRGSHFLPKFTTSSHQHHLLVCYGGYCISLDRDITCQNVAVGTIKVLNPRLSCKNTEGWSSKWRPHWHQLRYHPNKYPNLQIHRPNKVLSAYDNSLSLKLIQLFRFIFSDILFSFYSHPFYNFFISFSLSAYSGKLARKKKKKKSAKSITWTMIGNLHFRAKSVSRQTIESNTTRWNNSWNQQN